MGQYYKSVYFKDYPTEESKDKSITLAFNEDEAPYYKAIKDLTSEEVREAIGSDSYKQLSLFADNDERTVNQYIKKELKKNFKNNGKFDPKDVTFFNSKTVPFQRWYPFIEGYSPDFVKGLIQQYCPEANSIYDPFAGTGTTVFAADSLNKSSFFSEINPLLTFLIETKIEILNTPRNRRLTIAYELEQLSNNIFGEMEYYPENANLKDNYFAVFNTSKYFGDDTFSKILKLRSFIDDVEPENELLSKTLTIGVLTSLIPVSFLKKAGDLRFKTQKELNKERVEITNFLPQKLLEIAEDIKKPDYRLKTKPEFLLFNAKKIAYLKEVEIDAIITSPPYLNGTNYFRNTKLELWFLRHIKGENDLRYFRNQVLTSGINDVKKNNQQEDSTVVQKSPLLAEALENLEIHAYDKRIPKMVKSYFKEIEEAFTGIKHKLKDNGKVVIDIGDSVFADVHVKTDEILKEILEHHHFKNIESKLLRKRRSRNQAILKQSLLVFNYEKAPAAYSKKSIKPFWQASWEKFKNEIPHHKQPYAKRNWGHPNHSLCSYQGKLKPSIAHHLVKTFVPKGGKVLDPFAGVGTIPFEASLNGRNAYGFEISSPAYYISSGKINKIDKEACLEYIEQLADFIEKNTCTEEELDNIRQFGFNKKLSEYYHEDTLKELLKARTFFRLYYPDDPNKMFVIACLLHILHGNRPYALSRRSHPIIPYAPRGDFIYKNLVEHLKDKVIRTYNNELPPNFTPGKMFFQDATNIWPQEVYDLDAIITSPPFFDSTRFYLANWIRLWFAGWEEKDFKGGMQSFIEEKQKNDFRIYENIFRQARERLKKDGVFLLHLGKSKKCDMAKELESISKKWFKEVDLFDESVVDCESHGIKDKGTVTSHQYLLLK